MNIVMVTSEITPIAKTGGLADVVSALSANLTELGHDVRIILPRYGFIEKDTLSDQGIDIEVPLGFGWEPVHIFYSVLPETTVPVYFLEHEALFDRNGVYGSREMPQFTDNSRRFALLSRAVFPLCRKLDWFPDIIHSHDWPAALTPALLTCQEEQNGFQHCGTVLTIHNLGYQGIFSKHDLHFTGLDWSQLAEGGGPLPDTFNFLQVGLRHAHVLTTVSPTYAEEIQHPEQGYGADWILRERSDDLYGVLNGIDYTAWNPETDPFLPASFSDDDLSGKKKVKKYLQKKCGFPQDVNTPLIGMVSRLVEQKGFAELCGPSYGSLHSICVDLPLQWIILGTGESWCEEELHKLSQQLPNLAVFLEFNNEIAHLIEGGSDFFLMPSKYEPCGLNQMYSLRYGTLPVVRKTGGLADTVHQYDPDSGDGTGFLFEELTPQAIYDTVKQVIDVWHSKGEHIERMRKQAMQQRFSWEKSSRRYVELYQRALQKSRGG